MSSKFRKVRPWTNDTELAALKRLKVDVTIFSAVFNPILFILTGNDEMHWRSLKSSVIRPLTVELAALQHVKKIHVDILCKKLCCHFFSAVLNQILIILAGNDNIHKSMDEFDEIQ